MDLEDESCWSRVEFFADQIDVAAVELWPDFTDCINERVAPGL
jgi:hypothetical protein